MKQWGWAIGAALLLLAAMGKAGASEADAGANTDLSRLANMSLEDLMKTRVTTVSGRPSSRISTPAAVTVLTAEDIRRSGARNVAEALRLVPGMFVGRVNSSSWVVGARGLTGSSLTATRYLVLIDGRLVYDPLVSTTFWDTADTVLSDIDRIEVIRGPGATLWGANAMNGVISIITKRANETVGSLVELGAGNDGERQAVVRYGVARDEDTAWRVWAKYGDHGDFQNAAGASIGDEWSSDRAGFRYDGVFTPTTDFTLQGDVYNEPKAMETVLLPVPGQDRQFQWQTTNDTIRGGNLLFRIRHGYDQPRGWFLRAYYDRTQRDTSRFGVSRRIADVEYRRWLDWGDRNNLIWGLQYDWTHDDIASGPVLLFDPSARSWTSINAFVQNTTELVDDTLFAMVGTKFTDHSFVGFQTQPSVRVWWTPTPTQTLWAAVSRPVRVPSRFEENGELVFAYVDTGAIAGGPPSGVIVPLGLSGTESLRPEKLLAYELGHRLQVGNGWVFDTSLFYNDYRTLVGVPPGIFGTFNNDASGVTYGLEFTASAQLTDRWRMEGSWSRLVTRIDGPVLKFDETNTPRTLAQLHSYFDVGADVEVNASAYYVSRIPGLGVDPYTRADLGLTWRPRDGLALSLTGQNLLHAQHREVTGAEIPRSVFAQAAFEFGN